jgi:hypothetical protein
LFGQVSYFLLDRPRDLQMGFQSQPVSTSFAVF